MQTFFNKYNFRLFVLIIFVSTDYFKYALGYNYTAYICLIIMLVELFNLKTKFSNWEIQFLYFLSFITVISILTWDSLYSINSYLGLIPVFWITKSFPIKYLKKFFKIIILINLPIALYEYYYQMYLYEAIVTKNGEEIILSFRELSGNVMRSKGIFAGPLTLANFALGAALIFPKDKLIPISAIIICLFCNARLGIMCCTAIYFFHHVKFKFTNFRVLFSFTVLLVIYYYLLDESGINRLFDVFNLESGNNSSRLKYMSSSITLFNDYPLKNILFGNSGALLAQIGNNAESGWLTLLVENGIFGFSFYLLFFLDALKKSFKLKSENRLSLIILFAVMSIQTYYLSIIGPLLFWLLVFKENQNFKNR